MSPCRPGRDNRRCLGRDGLGVRLRDDAALHRRGAQPVGGVDADMRVLPELAVVMDGQAAQRRLTVRPVVHELACALEVVVELREKLRVVSRVPFEAHVEVEQQQRVAGRHVDRLHPRRRDGQTVQPGRGRRAVGVVEGIGRGRADRRQREEAVAYADRAAALQVALAVRLERLAGDAGNQVGRVGAARGLAVDQRARRGRAARHHPHLRPAHPEGEGRRGIGTVEERTRHRVRDWVQIGHGDDAEDNVVALAEEAGGEDVPVEGVGRCRWARW